MEGINSYLVLAIVVAVIVIVYLVTHIGGVADRQFREWKSRELDSNAAQQREIAVREAQTQLAQWRLDEEKKIRQDAIERSQAVITGKVSEHLAPYISEFAYNPKDARFVGSPVDFIVFDGLDEGSVRQVVFVEIKTGTGQLNKREKQVRAAVRDGNVVWEEVRMNGAVASSQGDGSQEVTAGGVVTGSISRLLIDKGFGFVRDAGGVEYFFHRSSVTGNVFEWLREGQNVTFVPESSSHGPRAGNVQPIAVDR